MLDTHDYMRVSSDQQLAEQWQTYKGYTVRPTPSTERYYASLLQRFGQPGLRVLVYGGTPELRDCVRRAGCRATLVDRSYTMVAAMGLLTEGAQPLNENEEFFESDWCNIALPSESFDLAMGDDAINMVRWDRFPAFLETARSLLRPGGLFACHLLVQPEAPLRSRSTASVIEDYERGLIPSHFELASRINFSLYDEQTYSMGWQRSIQRLEQLLAEGRIQDDHGFIERFRHCNSVFTCPPREEFIQLAERSFAIEEVFHPSEHDYCRFEPLYLLRRR